MLYVWHFSFLKSVKKEKKKRETNNNKKQNNLHATMPCCPYSCLATTAALQLQSFVRINFNTTLVSGMHMCIKIKAFLQMFGIPT